MRKKVLTTIIAFSTTTQAMAMEKKAAESGFKGRLIPVPREITAGCGLAWKCAGQTEETAESFLQEKMLAYNGIYRVLA